MKEIFSMVKFQETEIILLKMEAIIQENGLIIKEMVKEFFIIKIEIFNMKMNFYMVIFMEMENI